MQLYFRGPEVFCYSFVTIISCIITKDMDPDFPWIGFLYFSEKTDCCIRIEHFVFLDENFVVNHINHARKIYPGSSAISRDLFSHAFLDPTISWLYVVCWVNSIHETDRLICG